MKTKILIIFIFILCVGNLFANEPDSVYLKAYSTEHNNHKNGLHFAYSIDGNNWKSIGNEFSFLKSDYGNWGGEKRMFAPVLSKILCNCGGNPHEKWDCHFFVNPEHSVYGYAVSEDLISWTPQDYAIAEKQKLPFEPQNPDNAYKVPYAIVQNLINHCELTAYRNQQNAENARSFETKYPNLQTINASLSINFDNKKKISENLIGVFFEDINYAADGGLYAELIENRDFEYSAKDRKEWNAASKWTINDEELKIDTVTPIHPNNPHYAVLNGNKTLTNSGFDGINIRKGEKYNFSVFARAEFDKLFVLLNIQLVDNQGNIVSKTQISVATSKWKKYDAVLTANATVKDAKLQLSFSDFNSAAPIFDASKVSIHIDMVSLFPQKTFKNRKNGLRADLAQAIADLKPRFVRFPGGCVAHGQGIDNIYRWKNSISKLEERKPDFNLWGYHQTFGLGYFEYFQFCEDIGAEPLPVLAAGVPCQNSNLPSPNGEGSGVRLAGQQGGIPLAEMDAYIQDILDLIEWANGNKSTHWGKIRAQAGHPEPFNLKYIGIGNEDLISDVFKERFELIYNAIRTKHPEITVIGTVGPFHKGSSDYDAGWEFASKLAVPMVDEHYYESPAWFINNQNYYDNYDRAKSKVYLGEYAAHLAGRPNNVETALAEALHLCNVERNGDIVEMTSYAPLLAKEGHTQWNPDLIYFNNQEVKPTVGYEVQKLFGNNSGDEYVSSALSVDNQNIELQKRIAKSVVRDTRSGDLIIKLVNLLPVETNLTFQISDLTFEKIEKTVLHGNTTDKNVKPVTEIIDLQNNKIILEKYSLTVLRIKN